MNPFTRYPQHPDAHPERPWWRLAGHPGRRGYVRTDGAEVDAAPPRPGLGGFPALFQMDADTTELLAAYDAAHPLPCPEPAGGQVWWFRPVFEGEPLGFTDEDVVIRVRRWDDGKLLVCMEQAEYREWPPPGAVLVAGPGAPWAPAGWTP